MGVAGRDDEQDTGTTDEHVDDGEGSSEEQQTEDGEGEGGEGEQTEDVVQIGDEEPPASETSDADSPVFADLRRRYRELQQEHSKLKRQAQTGQPGRVEPPKLPEKPKLADFDYDEEKFQEALDGWYATKRDVEAHEAEQQAAVEAQKKAVEQVHQNYAASKAALKVKDFQDAEDEVQAQFSEVQQSIVIAGAANPAAIVYALGKNQKKLAELASIKDPVKFAFAVSKLEDQVKVTKRTGGTKPEPEKMPRGNTSTANSTAALERLEAEAARTGDRTKVAAWHRQQRLAGK